MKPCSASTLALLIAASCHISMAHAGQAAVSGAEVLDVMLQGSSSLELRGLVEQSGGKVTHDLHLIAAVGARVTRSQLEQILLSPLVERHLDDLSVSPVPEREPPDHHEGCNVGSALELDFRDAGISWMLYNKRPEPALLTGLEVSWPGKLGTVTSVRLANRDLDLVQLESAGDGSIKAQFATDRAPVLAGEGRLDISFSRFPESAEFRPQQRDFSVGASFSGNCTAKLIPAYPDNSSDFYYAEVIGADQLHRQGITGKGVTVAVLDSGLWEHPQLANSSSGSNRVVARYDAIRGEEAAEVFDESGHGTHMTSIIAHSGPVTREGHPTGSFKGIAPDVNLVAVKSFNTEGQGEMLDIVRGIQWVVDNRQKYNIRILNLSFASRPRWNYWLDPVNQAAMRAWASGITVVAAAGNEGPEPMSIGSPGNLPYVITVGALTDSWTPDDRDDDYIPDFSSRGPTPSAHIKPDIVAPGGHITGITRPGSSLTVTYPEYLLHTGEFVMSGSSQASALVSGIAALLLQLEPDLTPDDLKCKLTSSAEPAINDDGLLAYTPFEQGYGYVSATRAVTLGRRGCGNPELDIRRELDDQEHYQGPAIVDEDGRPSLPGLASIVSPRPSEKGMSTTRKWGVKDHIERLETLPPEPQRVEAGALNWYEMYLQEKATIETLTQDPTDNSP